jgi:hypothetical protein
MHQYLRRAIAPLLLTALVFSFTAAAAGAASIPQTSFGINFSGSPANLSLASTSGVGVSRYDFTVGSDMDSSVTLSVQAHLRPYAILMLPASHGAVADAAQMAVFVRAFALRYGPSGSFWAQNPSLPYLPVTSFEIGNEPNATPDPTLPPNWAQTEGPVGYALVYEAARNALHLVDPTGKAIVAGMLDSGMTGLAGALRYYAAIGPMDAVGFHPYNYFLSSMEADTSALRQWLSSHGHRTVPIDINEFDSMDAMSTNVSAWGRQIADFTQWALCTPGLGVENILPFWWGATPQAGQPSFPWYSLTDANGTATPFGTSYLNEVRRLTTTGCPAATTHPASVASRHPRRHSRRTAHRAER